MWIARTHIHRVRIVSVSRPFESPEVIGQAHRASVHRAYQRAFLHWNCERGLPDQGHMALKIAGIAIAFHDHLPDIHIDLGIATT